MPRNARVVAPGIPYHITQRGTNRQRVFFTVADRKLYLRLIRENLLDAGARVLAYYLDDQPRPFQMEERFGRRWRRDGEKPEAKIAKFP